eukprot:Selendium_serpulae@DN6891_c0_g1_i1.p1
MANEAAGSDKPHGEPPAQAECLVCFDDMTAENYLEYQTHANSDWHPSLMCSDCVGHVQGSQFHRYVKDLEKVNCAAQHRRMVEKGPPINLHDKLSFPVAEGGEIHQLWSFKDKQVMSAMLDGALTGEARQKFWDNSKVFVGGEDDEEKSKNE